MQDDVSFFRLLQVCTGDPFVALSQILRVSIAAKATFSCFPSSSSACSTSLGTISPIVIVPGLY